MSAEGFLVERAEAGVQYVPEQPVRWHEYADIFPWIEGQAFDDLVEDIRKNGVLEPIVFHEGAVLDGRNRYMAARQLGIEYPYVEYEGDDPLGYVISHNLKRRHLTESQRAMVGGRLAKLPRGGDRKSEAYDQTAHVRTDRAAQMLNVSPRSIESARAIERTGTPELVEAVERGEIRVRPAAEIAKLPKDDQPEAVQKHVRGTFGTGENEWYTPDEHLDLARKVLGGFDLDPASSHVANQRVKADQFFSQDTNGLEKDWCGRIWLNPPYAQPAISHFADKMIAEWDAGRVEAAIVLTHNYTDTAWFQKLAHAANAICFTRGRVRFVSPQGDLASPTQGQAFFYLGHDVDGFAETFGEIGFVVEVRA